MGYRIEEYRRKFNMTQEELSAKSGISRQTIILLENDEIHDVKFSTLTKIAKALNVTVQELFFDK